MFKTKLILVFCFLYLAVSPKSKAQKLDSEDRQELAKMEHALVKLADSMYQAAIPEERLVYCESFIKKMVQALKIPNSYYYDFAELGKTINMIAPDDKSFRILNWVVPLPGNQVRHYGTIQMPSEELKMYPLVDYANELGKFAEDSVLTGNKWFGALYYKIIASEVQGRKLYTLLGLNSSSPISNRKVMDPLFFTEEGIVFGAPVFNVSSENTAGRINRFIMEYKKDVQASLNWDNDKKMIYFDKLISQVNDPNRKYTFIPSGEYDGFRWENGQWNYVQNLIPVQSLKDGEAPVGKPLTGK